MEAPAISSRESAAVDFRTGAAHRWVFPRGAARLIAGDMKRLTLAGFPGAVLPGLLVTIALSALLVGCGSVIDTTTGGGSDGSSTGGGATAGSVSTGSMGPAWPKRIVLVNHAISNPGDSVRLEDASTVAGDGDVSLFAGKVLSIVSPTPESVCAKGTFPTLDDVPTAIDTCSGSLSKTWEHYAYLDAAWTHTTEESNAVGLGLLLRDKDHKVLYRARVVGDSYDPEGGSTATLDYEPVP